MEFYAGRWNKVVFYGDKIDELEREQNFNTYRYRIGDYKVINNRKDLKNISKFKQGDMYVYDDEVWVSTGEEYNWYRYKVIPNENRLMQRIKVVENENVRLKHRLTERLTYTVKPSHEQRKKNKENGYGYLSKSEKGSIIIIGLLISFAVAFELIRFLF